LVLAGQKRDHRANARFGREFLQGFGHTRHEAFVSVVERKAELGRRLELGVGNACVVERPLHQLFDELAPERGKRGALGASQNNDHGGAMAQAIVE
jgi:hypothetical protein